MSKESLRKQILDELETFQIPVVDTFFVSEKAEEICTQHFDGNVDDFFNELLAFRMNTSTKEDKPITQDFLDAFERSKSYKEVDGNRRKRNNYTATPTSRTSKKSNIKLTRNKQAAPSILSDYGILDLVNEKRTDDRTNIDNNYNDEIECMDDTDNSIGHTPPSVIDPETFSPAGITPSRQFIERQNAGQVVATFGDIHTDWTINGQHELNGITLVKHYESMPRLDKPFHYMNQGLRTIKEALDERVDYMVGQMANKYPEISQGDTDGASQPGDLIYVHGLLCNGDDSERATRLMVDNVFSRNARSTENGILIDLSMLTEYSLFSGEVVCFGGKMDGLNKLKAERILPGCLPQLATLETSDSGVPDRLSIFIASGPFTPADGFGYEPLVALLNDVQKQRPHILILIGPIIPASHDEILTLPLTYQEFFDCILIRIVDACSSAGTQLVIVASAEDAAMCPCYPTPPPRAMRSFDKMQPLFFSDPCLLRIGGLLFGITATDILFHLSSEELRPTTMGGDRMCRLVQHLFLQQTFFPLYPSPPAVSIELEPLNSYAKLPVLPHVLVLPSKVHHFLKDVDKVLAINPGHLAKGRVGGMFCRLEFDRRKLAHENGDVLKCLRAQLIRI